MLFASDYNDNRIHIDDTHSNCEYYCPYCGAPMITKKGEIRQHHFAHKAKHLCSDTWERTRSYDISPWHNEWQSQFPKNNQEVKLILGDTKHRADVMIGKTVIEFQHSMMPAISFDDRNNFYFNLGYKVVWLFDLSDLFENGQLAYQKNENRLQFSWRNPKKAFNCYDVKSGCIDLFFQMNNNEDSCIVRVTDISEYGFEQFETTEFMSKASFLHHVGLKDGKCAEPDRDDISKNESYKKFKEKYSISLNKQQERALQAVEGANLLLAVPGSGKTTVLVARLGYMIIEKQIDPSLILAVTYNKDAAAEMEERFVEKFGECLRGKVAFRTLNSLALSIYSSYCKVNRNAQRRLVTEKEHRDLIRKAYNHTHSGEYASENDILELQSAITYIKNMGLSDEKIKDLEDEMPFLSKMYAEYQDHLKKENQMDFDDQIVFAHAILKNRPNFFAEHIKQYKYICVDEAQDTSKLQHQIIEFMARENNLFMVGDEDQSIYGYRAAYPKALLNFRYTYRNPYILRMERNYRSTQQIVEKAQAFISQNKGRYEKNMVAERGDGENVSVISVKDRISQYKYLLDVAKQPHGETSFLYRDNESAVAFVDLFLRNNISFRLRKPELNFFGTKIVKDIVAYLSLAINDRNIDAFRQIRNKGVLYLKEQQAIYAIKSCVSKNIDIYDALQEQMQYLPHKDRDRAQEFKSFMMQMINKNSAECIQYICDNGYRGYMHKEKLDSGKIDILLILAEQEPDKQKFLKRLTYLEEQISKGNYAKSENSVILSTIHSSKGLEYDTVYMVDVYDGRLPSSRPNIFSRSKDSADGEQEERRLFYVGITRAKNRLFIMNMTDRCSSYIAELFPKTVVHERPQAVIRQPMNFVPSAYSNERMEQLRAERERGFAKREEDMARLVAKQKKEKEESQKRTYEACYREVCDQFNQQGTQIRDHTGRRWVKCELCGEIKPESEFGSYGGIGHVNLGVCYDCSRRS